MNTSSQPTIAETLNRQVKQLILQKTYIEMKLHEENDNETIKNTYNNALREYQEARVVECIALGDVPPGFQTDMKRK